MTLTVRRAVVLGVLLAVAVPAVAEFRASDLLYLPVAAHNEGVEGSLWRTDLTITNVDDVPIDVCIFFFPAGLFNNAGYLARSYGLGGRESEQWGHVNEELADIPPLGTVVLEDVVSTWLDQLQAGTSLGAMVIFAYEAGTLDQPDGRVFRNAVATSRTYNETTVWVPVDPANPVEFTEEPTSYGQSVAAVPWYNLADPAYISDEADYTYYILTGGEESEEARYNVGIFNCSDSQTYITLLIKPFQSDGTPFLTDTGDEKGLLVTVPPLAFTQYNRILSNAFQIDEAIGASIKISFYSWSTTSPDPNPAFAVYGSQIDATSNDPTTVLPSFGEPYNVECTWPPDGLGGGKVGSPTARTRRPLDVPPRSN